MKSDVRHPDISTLALLAGGELPFLPALLTRGHLYSCEKCAREFEAFRAARVELRRDSVSDAPQTPDGQPAESDAAWNALEAEMRANIRLGLTADSLAAGSLTASDGEAAARAPGSYTPWRWAAVCGALAFVLVAGWSLRSTGGAPRPVASAPVQAIESADPVGHGAGIQLLVPVTDVSRTETDFDGSTRSRVIDNETGQVTLQQVYVE
jgi:hypothetical protein